MVRVIIAEDDPLVGQLNAQYLNQLGGLRVQGIFPNGEAAFRYLQSNPVDLAIVDVYMPVCGGLDLLRRIRGAGIQTAVIMITAATEMAVVEEALRLGIEDYIIKPFAYDRLGNAVGKYLSKADLVKSSANADQQMVDLLLSKVPAAHAAPELPKGLNAKTLASIQNILSSDRQGSHTCESLSAASGLSKVTVRHYLNYLIESGTLSSSIDYETGGRPRVLYKLK